MMIDDSQGISSSSSSPPFFYLHTQVDMQQLLDEQMRNKLSKQELLRSKMTANGSAAGQQQSSTQSGAAPQQRKTKFLGIFQRSWTMLIIKWKLTSFLSLSSLSVALSLSLYSLSNFGVLLICLLLFFSLFLFVNLLFFPPYIKFVQWNIYNYFSSSRTYLN